jgi:ubiquinol-cytochrome c reductase cytochrome c subunit
MDAEESAMSKVRSIMVVAAVGVLAQPAGDPKAGEAAYKKLGCYSCHGIWGQGTWRDGPRLNPPMPYEAMLQQLRTPRLEMPPYVESVAPDKTVADIHAYLQDLPKAVDPNVIRALQ